MHDVRHPWHNPHCVCPTRDLSFSSSAPPLATCMVLPARAQSSAHANHTHFFHLNTSITRWCHRGGEANPWVWRLPRTALCVAWTKGPNPWPGTHRSPKPPGGHGKKARVRRDSRMAPPTAIRRQLTDNLGSVNSGRIGTFIQSRAAGVPAKNTFIRNRGVLYP